MKYLESLKYYLTKATGLHLPSTWKLQQIILRSSCVRITSYITFT